MNELSMSGPRSNAYIGAGVTALLPLVLTTIHHAYGAVVYGTPWRMHVVYVAVPAAIVIVAALWLAWLGRGLPIGRRAALFAVVAIVVLPVAGIGFFEGGYNHVLKNVVFFTLGHERALSMFPPPVYELPNDLFFELTGVAQFPLSILAATRALALLREVRVPSSANIECA